MCGERHCAVSSSTYVIAASRAVLRYLTSPVDVIFPDFQIRSVISCGALCALHAIHLWTHEHFVPTAARQLLGDCCQSIVPGLYCTSESEAWPGGATEIRGFRSAFDKGSNFVGCEAVWLANGCPRVNHEDAWG
jgi:hypothetical protein